MVGRGCVLPDGRGEKDGTGTGNKGKAKVGGHPFE